MPNIVVANGFTTVLPSLKSHPLPALSAGSGPGPFGLPQKFSVASIGGANTPVGKSLPMFTIPQFRVLPIGGAPSTDPAPKLPQILFLWMTSPWAPGSMNMPAPWLPIMLLPVIVRKEPLGSVPPTRPPGQGPAAPGRRRRA